MEKKRRSFSGKIGFVLAAAGSAVGLGNLWRFPYLAARYGGGIFLLVYVILAVTFGFALMTAEIALGRKTGLSAIGAFRKLNKKYSFIGYLAALVPIIILPYYSVIGGWVIKYLTAFASGQTKAAAKDGYFEAFIGETGEPILWLAIFVLVTAVVVFLGVEKGIEKVSKALMPLLVLLTVGIAIYSVTLPGAWDGLLYYITPDFSRFSFTTVVAAMGQLFYSMSLAMGIMITYGSYMKKDVNLEKSVAQIEVFDTGIAFFAGMMIVPAVFVFNGGDGAAINAGPGLMFVAVALPSSLGFGRWSDIQPLGMSFLDFFDFISNSVLMPIVAFLTCVFVGFVVKPKTVIDEVKLNSSFGREKLFVIMIKYVSPICLIVILVSSILNALGIITI